MKSSLLSLFHPFWNVFLVFNWLSNTLVRVSTLLLSFTCQHMAVLFLHLARESLRARILLCTSQSPSSALKKVHSIQRCGMTICLQFLLLLHVAFYMVQRLLENRQSRVKSQSRKWQSMLTCATNFKFHVSCFIIYSSSFLDTLRPETWQLSSALADSFLPNAAEKMEPRQCQVYNLTFLPQNTFQKKYLFFLRPIIYLTW